MPYKIFSAFLLALLFFGCANTPKPPSWYLTPSKSSSKIFGYGSGASLEIAKNRAREDIATSLNVHIKSEFTINAQRDINSTKQDIKSSLHSYSEVVLSQIKLLHSEHLDDMYYVALMYENLPLAQKVYQSLKATRLQKMPQEHFYAQTLFSKSLKKLFGYTPKYELFFKDSLYFLHIAAKVFPLKESDLKYFFFEKESEDISLEASSKRLHVSNYFHFTLQNSKAGFVSLLEVDEEGRVIVHLDNQKMPIKSTKLYPDSELYEGLQAGIVNHKERVNEQFIALLCHKKVDLTLFENASQSFNENKQAMRYSELSKIIDGCEYTSVILKIIREKIDERSDSITQYGWTK